LSPDRDKIERLVEIAADEKTPAARHRLFQNLRRVEVFFSLKTKHHQGDQVRATPLLRLPDGTHAMMLYTCKSHPELSDSFGGGFFADALAAAVKMSGLDWVILSNCASRWVAIRKEEIAGILADLDADGKERTDPHKTSGDKSSDEMLQSLITQAVRCSPEDVSPPIGWVLAGRELFLELTSKQGEEGRPVMKLFQVGGLPNVVRAFLTRNRPGINYGGIRWEALKEAIRNEPSIDGVQVVNDADDWVVFDRDSLGVAP
jgi:hypothetical protein